MAGQANNLDIRDDWQTMPVYCPNLMLDYAQVVAVLLMFRVQGKGNTREVSEVTRGSGVGVSIPRYSHIVAMYTFIAKRI